uniref:Uncharacterized protein n=1 Tax=Monopterus albus TaxID=43700 RepID=A0A3Q3K7F9_MONAL
MEHSSVASASSETGSTRSQEIEELERFIDSYVLEYQVQGLLGDKADLDLDNVGNVPQVEDMLSLGPYLLAAVVMFRHSVWEGYSMNQNTRIYTSM